MYGNIYIYIYYCTVELYFRRVIFFTISPPSKTQLTITWPLHVNLRIHRPRRSTYHLIKSLSITYTKRGGTAPIHDELSIDGWALYFMVHIIRYRVLNIFLYRCAPSFLCESSVCGCHCVDAIQSSIGFLTDMFEHERDMKRLSKNETTPQVRKNAKNTVVRQ